MIKYFTAILCISLLAVNAAGQGSDELREKLQGEYTWQDTIRIGESLDNRIQDAILFAEREINRQITENTFKSNYKLQYIEVFWITDENEILRLTNIFMDGNDLTVDSMHKTRIEDKSNENRIVIRYNLRFNSKLDPKRGFSIYVELAGNKSSIKLEGLAKLTAEKNLTNILSTTDFYKKLKRLKVEKEVKTYINETLTPDLIGLDYRKIPNENLC
jgi:hypothetical protein